MVTAPNVQAQLTAPNTVALPVVLVSSPPRIDAMRSWSTKVSISAVISTPSRIGHSAL